MGRRHQSFIRLCDILKVSNSNCLSVKTTAYFEEQVLRKRPYLKQEWCLMTINNPVKKETQDNGRIRHWKYISELNRYLRVITLEDGETIHNAFPDRNFKE